MRLDEGRLGLAGAAVAAIPYSLCALFVALTPDAEAALWEGMLVVGGLDGVHRAHESQSRHPAALPRASGVA